MQTYTSVTGSIVKSSTKTSIVDDNIISCFIDPITHDIMKFPVFLPNTSKIYDKESIIKWFGTSNIDPLTGVELDFTQIKFIHIIPYFLFLSCIEKRDEQYIFHHPFGTLCDILEIATHYAKNDSFDNNFLEHNRYFTKKCIKVDDTIYQCECDFKQPGAISFDLTDYYMEIVKCVELTEQNHTNTIRPITHFKNTNNAKYPFIPCNNPQLYHIDIFDIIGKCPLTKRGFKNKCYINDNGWIIAEYHNTTEKCSSYIVGSIANHLSENKQEFTNTQLFDLIPTDSLLPASITFERCPIEMDADTQKFMKDYRNIEQLDLIYANQIRPVTHDYLFAIWKQPDCNIAKGGDFYIECTNTHKKLHNFYIQHLHNYDKNIANKISSIVNKNDFIFKGCSDLPINNLKIQYSFPIAGSTVYGDDYSFLTICNKNITNDFKGDYFIGTHLVNCVFTNCGFSMCAFAGSTFVNTKFIDCKFRECSLYKMGSVDLLGCSADTKTINGLNME